MKPRKIALSIPISVTKPSNLIGKLVRLKGRKKTARIEASLSPEIEGGIKVFPPLNGYAYWNVLDMEFCYEIRLVFRSPQGGPSQIYFDTVWAENEKQAEERAYQNWHRNSTVMKVSPV